VKPFELERGFHRECEVFDSEAEQSTKIAFIGAKGATKQATRAIWGVFRVRVPRYLGVTCAVVEEDVNSALSTIITRSLMECTRLISNFVLLAIYDLWW